VRKHVRFCLCCFIGFISRHDEAEQPKAKPRAGSYGMLSPNLFAADANTSLFHVCGVAEEDQARTVLLQIRNIVLPWGLKMGSLSR